VVWSNKLPDPPAYERLQWQTPRCAFKPTPPPPRCSESQAGIADYATARELERSQSSQSAAHFLTAAKAAYEVAISTPPHAPVTEDSLSLYHAALARYLSVATGYNLLPQIGSQGLCLTGGDSTPQVDWQGFSPSSQPILSLVVVGDYSATALKRRYRACGLGVPVVIHQRLAQAPTGQPQSVWRAATVILAPTDACPSPRSDASASESVISSEGAGDMATHGGGWKLTFYNPIRYRTVELAGCTHPLASDLTAAWGRGLATSDPPRLIGFLDPNSGVDTGRLEFTEPYEPGRIPVVFVHGLASNAQTWIAMLNDLQADDQLMRRYQFWTYSYPTGRAFLASAADLRQKLTETVQALEAESGSDPALHQMVLVGHSMGGLLTRLLVSPSGNQLWQSAACVPLEQLRLEPETRNVLQQTFFFEPLPFVKRAVFIATPHRGSSLAQCGVGRLASWLVDLGPGADTRREEVVEWNSGKIKPWLQKKIPTSVDLLEPTHPLLQAIDQLPLSNCVSAHSIIGDGCCTRFVGHPSDGVVPVSSARLTGVASELYVDERHQNVQRSFAASQEVRRILCEHVANTHPSSGPTPEPEFELPPPIAVTQSAGVQVSQF
jgi:pimeloyl-ACP methyl ester carboxylesterase